ncbi:uncharacterized protein [Rutidosis leptorrhynchoides]|uniref:uncharacterized protein n=1 Tax=Rutidosis leptorrhynchoides TaxID=125765 RepID=UPI003A98D379
MANTDITVALSSTPSILEQLRKALTELEAHKNGTPDTVSLTEIIQHFRDLETKMTKKYNELEDKERAFKQDESDSRALLAAQETAVAAKEQDMFDRIQFLKDAAAAAIVETRANHLPPSVSVDIVEPTENTVSSYLDETGGEITFHQELIKFCEEMDSNGLLNFVTENKNILRDEISRALTTCTEPCRLILDSLSGFYDTAALQGTRESCISLIEALNAMLAQADSGVEHLLTYDIKQQAKAIADVWRGKLLGHDDIIDDVDGKSLEAEAFLQLLSTFKIASEFEEDELCKLVIAVCERKQAPKVCRSLGLAHKMPGVIEELISKGKIISAVHFVHAFELVDKFPTVPLLKTYLKDLRRDSQLKCIASRNSEIVQNEGNKKELAALKDVIHCVEKYNLQSDYPLDPLHKRVGQLERANPDNRKRFRGSPRESTTNRERKAKRDSSTTKHESPKRRDKRPPNKKPRSNRDGLYGTRSPAASYLAVNGRQAPAPVYIDRRQYHAPPYNYQPAISHSQPTYSQPIYEQKAYYYPHDDRSAATAATPLPPAYENTYYTPQDDRAAVAPTPSVYENTYYYPPDNRAAAAPPPATAYESVYYYPPDDRAAAAQPVPPPHAYVGYHGSSGLPSSYQPYNTK